MRVLGESVKKAICYIVGALVAGVVSVAFAAAAGADEKDVDFTNFLAMHGIHLGTASQTGNMARTMCQDLDAGNSQADEVKELTDHKLTQAQAEFFVGAATAEYCPKYHSPNRPGG